MDLLETPSFTGIVLLQTVLDELRNRSLPLYNRLRAMTKTDRKGMYIFHNDFRAETYITRTKGETINDRNDRGKSPFPHEAGDLIVAIREAAKWYKKHLTASMRASKIKVPEIVLLSNDQGNLEKAKSEGVAAVSSMDSHFPLLCMYGY
jgi:exosome complex exonuclease DIS3/RRP44